MMGSGLTIALAIHLLDGILSSWNLYQDLLSRLLSTHLIIRYSLI